MKSGTGGGAGSGDVAAILGDLGLYQYNIQHSPHLRTFRDFPADFPSARGILYAKTFAKSIQNIPKSVLFYRIHEKV
jgi:hypothetical protein